MSSKYLVGLPTRTDSAAAIPRIPSHCGVADCRGETAVAMVSGEKDGRQFVSAGSTFLAARHAPEGVTYTELNSCRFDHWITRCAACYERDMERAGKAQSQQLPQVRA